MLEPAYMENLQKLHSARGIRSYAQSLGTKRNPIEHERVEFTKPYTESLATGPWTETPTSRPVARPAGQTAVMPLYSKW